ncbi:tRNA-specific adenosine deaminase subunit TAD3 [Lachnellula cervina]|uniref:tRNA-specific adenosine deaminase subunit TAD3 n=1 Tax=Lachnellula cervina TaxID=1316786 RepID=A0A7D8UQZ1_9HELO|nr:tRNA-specific adenosine deaminase subunit TAD3 [Lachnellula cervina]
MTDNTGNLQYAEPYKPAEECAINRGSLSFLKTKLETRAGDNVMSVHVTAVPVKLASTAIGLIRTILPNDGGIDLQHLRRFAKYHEVNDHVRSAYAKVAPRNDGQKVFVIAAPIAITTRKFLADSLSPTLGNLVFFSIDVPLQAPTSQEQAAVWSSQWWPTVYKKSNPFGPHPSIMARAEEDIEGDVRKWMDLAAEVAQQSKAAGFGEAVGVVIVERINGVSRPVAVAADARWLNWPSPGPGNVSAHAALRAIDMISHWVRRSHEAGNNQEITTQNVGIFRGKPGLPLEEEHYRAQTNQTGYLCHDLEIYCTHEPCVMCSMAIVHSRFGRVVFEHRMHTGGLCADGGLGHGLFWRKELNWQLLAWQWTRPTSDIEIGFDQLRISDNKTGGDELSTRADFNA